MGNSLLAILTNTLYHYEATFKIHKKSIKLSTICVNVFSGVSIFMLILNLQSLNNSNAILVCI